MIIRGYTVAITGIYAGGIVEQCKADRPPMRPYSIYLPFWAKRRVTSPLDSGLDEIFLETTFCGARTGFRREASETGDKWQMPSAQVCRLYS